MDLSINENMCISIVLPVYNGEKILTMRYIVSCDKHIAIMNLL